MATNGWGKGVDNNTINWGRGKDNATNDWGKIYETSASGDTALAVSTVPFSNTKSVDFDGVDDNVVLSSTTNLRPTEAELNASGFTVSLWVKQDSASTQGFFANDGVGQSNYYGLEFSVKSTGKFSMQKFSGSAPASTGRSSVETTTTVLALNTWTHVMYVMPSANKSTWKIYVNGVSQTLTTSGTGGNVAYLNGTASIGATRTSKFFNGNLDEVAVWNSDQSANISSIYSASGAVDLSSLNPTSWYRMGDGDTFPTLTDNGSGGNNGTMTNMVAGDIVADVPPTFNKFSLDFDGVDDFVDIGNPTNLQITGAMTLSAWIKRDSSASANNYVVIGKDGINSGTRSYLLSLNNSSFKARIGIFKSGSFSVVESTTVISTGVWYHIMGVNDGSDLKIYVNGVLEATNSSGGGVIDNGNTDFGIGRRDGAGANAGYWNGKIDEVAVWNSDQSSNVTTIYNSGVPNDLNSLSPLGYWRFEEGSGTTATDSGSGANDGTITNGATYSTDKP